MGGHNRKRKLSTDMFAPWNLYAKLCFYFERKWQSAQLLLFSIYLKKIVKREKGFL